MGFLDQWRAARAEHTTVVTSTRVRGNAAEDRALAYLQAAGLQLLVRNYRTPGRGGGEIDLIVRERDATIVFVEVRSRASRSHGGAGASISRTKQQRIIFAARHYLLCFATPPPCRFDAVLIEGEQVQWVRAAFDVSS